MRKYCFVVFSILVLMGMVKPVSSPASAGESTYEAADAEVSESAADGESTYEAAAAEVSEFTPSVEGRILIVGTEGQFRTITDAVAAALDGDEIVLGDGVYDSSSEQFPIEIHKRLYLHADSGCTPTIRCEELVTAFRLCADGIRLEGLNLEFLRYGIYLLSDDITISSCSFRLYDTQWRETSCGMWTGGAKHMVLTGNTFTDCGIALAGPEENRDKTGVPVLTALFEVGEDIEYFTTHTIADNFVNGKPMVYVTGLENCIYDPAGWNRDSFAGDLPGGNPADTMPDSERIGEGLHIPPFDEREGDLKYQSGSEEFPVWPESVDCGQIIAVDCHCVTFRGLDVSAASIGMQMIYCDNIRITDSRADDCGVFGIYVAKTRDSMIDGIEADRSAHGIDLRDVDRCIVMNCTTTECGQGVFFSYGRNSLVNSCNIINCGTGVFSASGGSNQVDNCLIEGNQLGLYIQHEPFVMTDSVLRGNTAAGLRVTECSPVVSGCSFENNFVAALILSSRDVTFTGNSFSGSENSSLYLKDSESVSLIRNLLGESEADKMEQINTEDLLLFD